MTEDEKQNIISAIIKDCTLSETGADLQEALRLTLPFMREFCRGQEPEDWLQYTYHFLLSQFFPANYQCPDSEGLRDCVTLYLQVLNGVFERERRECSFDRCRDFDLLRKEEEAFCSIPEEYETFVHCFHDEYVYAFMRLSQICTPFNTLGHVAGVHYVAMYMARQLLQTEVEIDPGLMSGAAALHDIGKFGCRPSEARRVPYLHYYYTYQFCDRYHLTAIGSIASNHSVWDLELENLSVENLLLIYADFRVKSTFDEQHTEHIRFWTLDEAYDVILSKLDNVDEKKRRRYAKVYAKLKDFENYMVSLGCATDLESQKGDAKPVQAAALMDAASIVERFKMLAIRSNLSVMYNIGHASRFTALLENIRSEKDWRHVRSFLTAIDEYSTYLAQPQKDVILQFLYDMLSHRDGDVRRQAASTAGRLIAGYEISYTKEVPAGLTPPEIGGRLSDVWDKFLCRILHPSITMPEREKRWTGYALKTVLHTLLDSLAGEKHSCILSVYAGYCKDSPQNFVPGFFLMNAASEISFADCDTRQGNDLTDFAVKMLRSSDTELSIASLVFFLHWMRQGWRPSFDISALIREVWPEIDSEQYCVRYLAARIREFCSIPSDRGIIIYDLSRLYLENQRAEIPWICKYVNLEILRRRQALNCDQDQLYQYASHLLNVLQFSERVVNRLQAGVNLVEIMPKLSCEQRHEIVIELIRALEVGEYAAARHIPAYLGRIYYLMPSHERTFLLERFHGLVCSTNARTVIVTLETMGAILSNQPETGSGSGEILEELGEERERVEGILCEGIAHYNPEIVQEALYAAGHDIFGSRNLTLVQKKECFSDLARKILTLADMHTPGLYLYYNAAALNHVYRFLSDYLHEEPDLPFREREMPTAFFPGTFDPFSRGHKAMVRELQRMGYRVYLAEDEFSWSKNTQPYEMRRKILQISTADMKDVYLFPQEIPVNIANPDDLKRLCMLFGGRKPYIVAGMDVPANASAYKAPDDEYSIHRFPHILFERAGISDSVKNAAKETIHADVHYSQLPPDVEAVSSTGIRENVSSNRDISNLVDENVQNYIYAMGMYSMEPVYKKTARATPIDTCEESGISGLLRQELEEHFGRLSEDAVQGSHILYLRDAQKGGRICGAVLYHEIDRSMLFTECGDLLTAEKLRTAVSGKVAVITQAAGDVSELDDKRLTVINELLVHLQERGFSYALSFHPEDAKEALTLHGAVPLAGTKNCLLIDLRHPMVVFYDTVSAVKEPFAANAEIRKAIRRAHLRLLRSIIQLYPGELVLTFDTNILNYRLIRLITKENQVDFHPCKVKASGSKICVPFGKILKGALIPNTVTKELNTEKLYDRGLSHFEITEFPGYAPLAVQIRTIKSFRRDIILVDDLYHKGYRLHEISRCLHREGIDSVKMIVGVISGHGRDIAQFNHQDVEAAYMVPGMRSWLIESDLFPFLGGDGIRTEHLLQTPVLPSVNAVLPYDVPSFLKGASLDAFYHMSGICLENARDIFTVIEQEYSRVHGRKLTLERLGEVTAVPRYPDGAGIGENDMQEAPSVILEGELDKWRRLRHLLDGGYR